MLNVYQDPWLHATIDNFLDENEFKKFKSYCDEIFQNLNPTQTSKHIHKPDQDKIPDIYNLGKEVAAKNWPILCNAFDVEPFEYNELWVEYSCFNGPCSVGIHTDRPEKFISCLVFVSENGAGTKLYASPRIADTCDPIYVKTIEWKQNRAFAFLRTGAAEHAVGDCTAGMYRTVVNFIYIKK